MNRYLGILYINIRVNFQRTSSRELFHLKLIALLAINAFPVMYRYWTNNY